MVSNAADISIPVILISKCVSAVFAASHLWVQTTSEVLLNGRKPLWFAERYSSTLSLILFRVINDSVFLTVFRRVTGLKFFMGPFCFPGLGNVLIFPLLIFSGRCVSKVSLKQLGTPNLFRKESAIFFP